MFYKNIIILPLTCFKINFLGSKNALIFMSILYIKLQTGYYVVPIFSIACNLLYMYLAINFGMAEAYSRGGGLSAPIAV